MEFLIKWFLGFLACTVLLVGIGAIIVIIWLIMETFGAWAFLLILPALFGIAVAISDL